MKTGRWLVGGLVILAAACGWSPNKDSASTSPDNSGWHSTIQSALADAKKGPRIIVVTRAGWSSYEKNTYDNAPSVQKLIAGLSRARLDLADDTARLEALGVDHAPALLILNEKGRLITRLIGPRDLSIVRHTLQRAIEYPLTREELDAKNDTPSHLRSIEVAIEAGDFDSAAIAARRYLSADASAEAQQGQYLYAYASAESGNRPEALKWTEEYLKRYPRGADRAATMWITIVLDLQSDQAKPAEARVSQIIAEDSSSPFARQAVIAYSMEYLARGKRDLKGADDYLTRSMADSNPWTEDFLMARSTLRLSTPRTMGAGIADVKTIASGHGSLSSDAQDRLVTVASSPAGSFVIPDIILYFQDLAARPADDGAARFRLARLYILSDNTARAKEEAKTLIAKNGEYADDAMLLLGVLALEVDRDPAAAVPIFRDAIKKYPNRETVWPARYGLARALFFSGDLAETRKALDDIIGYLTGRRYLPEAFLVVLPQAAPPQAIAEQFRDYRSKIDSLMNETDGQNIFKQLLGGVIASSKSDTVGAESTFKDLIAKHPASSLADDAWFELAKIYVRNHRLDEAKQALERIVTSYKGSDQFDSAKDMLNMISGLPSEPKSNQAAFINAVERLKPEYKSAPNELKKSALRTQRGKLIQAALNNSRTVTNWIGTVSQMNTNGEGKAILSIQLDGSDIEVKTWNNALSDLSDNTLIPQGSNLFTAISEMKKGDRVAFSGTFRPSSKFDFIKESSLTEYGSMSVPAFIIKFSSVEKI